MSWSFKDTDQRVAKLQLEAITHGNVRKGRAGVGSHVYFRSRARREFLVSRDEIGVKVCLKDVANGDALLCRSF